MRLLLKASILFILVSCGGGDKVKWEPQVWVGDADFGGIRNKKDEFISAYDIEFNKYGCLHKTDFQRLAAILTVARIPERYQDLLEEELAKIKRELNATQRVINSKK